MVSEVVTNAVRAHARTGVTATIEITCRAATDGFEVAVRDHGGGFEPEVPPDPPRPDELRPGGLGLTIVSMLADEARYARTEHGTDVRLVLRPHRGDHEERPR
jgi:anti-sigma regulatory factor (Ser/Thr protein kinase)